MAVFWPGTERENCGRGDWGENWKYDVKMPNGENYVWVRKQKKSLWFFCAAVGLPLCWWSQRAPCGPTIIWTLEWGRSVWEKRCVCVCVWTEVRWHVGPLVYSSISADIVPDGHWLQGQVSVDWQRSWWTSHNLSGEISGPRWGEALEVTAGLMKNHFIINLIIIYNTMWCYHVLYSWCFDEDFWSKPSELDLSFRERFDPRTGIVLPARWAIWSVDVHSVSSQNVW